MRIHTFHPITGRLVNTKVKDVWDWLDEIKSGDYVMASLSEPRTVIPGTDKQPLDDDHVFGAHKFDQPCDPAEVIDATIYMADNSDALALEEAMKGLGLWSEFMGNKMLKVRGPIATMQDVFGVQLHQCVHEEGMFRSRTAPISVPSSLANMITDVHGLDNRPVARPRFRKLSKEGEYEQRGSGVGALWPHEVAQACNFPQGMGDGSDLYIGIGSLGGGYKLSDLELAGAKCGYVIGPGGFDVRFASGDGSQNTPGDPADGENQLDLQCILGALAAAGLKRAHVILFKFKNTSQGMINCQAMMANWTDPTTGKRLAAINWSWGSAEPTNTKAQMNTFGGYVDNGLMLGVTTCAASGDDGSSDGTNTTAVDFPSSYPGTIGVGGTRLIRDANGVRVSETVWGPKNGATGGGASAFFAVPSYQTRITQLRSRGVPDVAFNADPVTGYRVFVDGAEQVIGGTSGASPMMVALLGIVSTYIGHGLGDVHELIYAHPTCCYDVVKGSNGQWVAGVGYDVCTGNGVPDGGRLLQVVTATFPPPSSAPLPIPSPLPIPTPAPVVLNQTEQAIADFCLSIGMKVNSPAVAGQHVGIN